MFKNPFSFDGRIRRLEYGLSIIIYYAAIFIAAMLGQVTGAAGPIVMFIAVVGVAWFMMAQAAKRCHDIGNSGWWQLIPIYNPFFLLFDEGDQRRNEYGSSPKYPEQEDVLESETLDGHLKN